MIMAVSGLNMERMVAAFWQLFLLVSKTASGTLLELTSPAGINPVDTSQYGVDVTRCTGVRFQLKSCYGAHVWLGNGTGPGSYETAVGVGTDFAKTELRPCSICYSSPLKSFLTKDILACSSFRTFWMTWGNSRIAFGKCQKPGINTIFDVPDPQLHEIQVLGFMGYSGTSVTVRLGTNDNSRFRAFDNAMFSDTPLVSMTTSFLNCTHFCHNHNNCGMISYNRAEGACAVFDRMASNFSLAPQAGWKSWKMLYCWS